MDKRAKERVLIAKDALAWIKAGALIPKSMVYVRPSIIPDVKNRAKQLRDVVLGQCQVCAKGALFLAKAVRFNNVLAMQWDNTNGACIDGGVMTDHFDSVQLDLIEAAFECSPSFGADIRSFYWRYPNESDRLVAILNNIIRNNGTFDPAEELDLE